MTWVTREEWGARRPKAGPGALAPARVEGVALHWPAMSRPAHGIENVARLLRAWQASHMDSQGWSDIGYQEAIDQDGNVYQLRGLSTQSGANGDQDVNERFGALLLVLAPGEHPTPAMTKAVRRRVAEHRRRFPNSRAVVGHQDVRPEPTACPGPIVMALIRAGAFTPGARRRRTPNNVTRARAALHDAVADLQEAREYLEATPASRDAARDAGGRANDLAAEVATLLERMPKR